ncbi:MAG TPA: PAS domain S-box protein, partial [Sphingomonadales bacterium]|nr:PAS domain S-box protein [Sphingomonadales bacterium]
MLDFRQFQGLKRGWGTTLGIFILIQALLLMMFSISWRVYTVTTVRNREAHDVNLTAFAAGTLRASLADLVTDTRRLALFIDDHIQRGDLFPNIAADLESGFVWMSRYDEHYSAIRFVGPNGRSLLRVTRNGDEPMVAPTTALGDWSNHAFFIEGRHLPVGQVLVTPIEMTDERAPGTGLQPIIHATAAIRDPASDALLGLVVVDFTASRLFSGLQGVMTQATGQAAILDQDGFVLVRGGEYETPVENIRFGASFAELFPDAWAALGAELQTATRLDDFIVVAERIPLSPGHLLPGLEGAAATPVGAPRGELIVVSFVLPPRLAALAAANPGPVLASAFGVSLFGIILALFFSNVIELRREAARKLRDEVLFRSFVQNTMTQGLIVIDAKGVILSVNAAAKKIFGYAENELLGLHLEMLMTPETHRRCSQYIGHILRGDLVSASAQHLIEVTGVHKDGHEMAIELSIGQGAAQGETLFIGLVRDVTARKAEQA